MHIAGAGPLSFLLSEKNVEKHNKKNNTAWLPWGLLGAFAALLLLAELMGWLARWDESGHDWLLRLNAQQRQPVGDIVLVNIDQKSLENIDEAMGDEVGAWPWPRGVHAELIEGIERQQPRAIVFDLMFNERDSVRADSDMLLHDTASRYENLYFPSLLLSDGKGALLAQLPQSLGARALGGADLNAHAPLLLPLILEQKNWRGGLINFYAPNGVGRHYPLEITNQGWLFPSLPRQLATDSGWASPASEAIRLNWYGRAPHSASYSDVIADFTREHPQRAPDEFRDKIVIIGASAPGLQDFRPTPLSANQPGAEILATAIANLKDGDWLRDLPSRPVLLLFFLPALAWAFARRRQPFYIGSVLAAASLLTVGSSYSLLHVGHWYAPVTVALVSAWLLFAALTLNAQLQERRERMAAISLFNRFLDPRVVGDLVKSGEISPDQKPQAREISILFSDIRGFTTLSETRSPEAVVELLNKYFSAQVAVIFKHGGTLDKFIGDAIMAFWNAPTHDAQHAANAVAASVEMALVLDDFKRELKALDPGLGDFDIGIGIHTGPAVVGFIGSSARLDYTAIGDTVNLASRIEGCTKGVARVLVSAATREACAERFSFVDHGLHHVKGREQGVQLFEPKQHAPDTTTSH